MNNVKKMAFYQSILMLLVRKKLITPSEAQETIQMLHVNDESQYLNDVA